MKSTLIRFNSPVRIFENISVSIDSLFQNKLRTILTGLGIIFGVASVLAMISIGNGARQELLEQLKFIGANNIIVSSKQTEKSDEFLSRKNSPKVEPKPSISLADFNNISATLGSYTLVSPESQFETSGMANGIIKPISLIGIKPDYLDIFSIKIDQGVSFKEINIQNTSSVCIIGHEIAKIFFPKENAVGKSIKVGNSWLKIIGTLERKQIPSTIKNEIKLFNTNNNIYLPIGTLQILHPNLVVQSNTKPKATTPSNIKTDINSTKQISPFNKFDRVIIHVVESNKLNSVASVISNILIRRHELDDFEVQVPKLLMEQEQRSREILNYVLSTIAGISLIVGGIGIMNTILASVLERTSEIGIRRAVGAKPSDIFQQFFVESTLICTLGGGIGVILGLIVTIIMSEIIEVPIIISFSSIFISFLVCVLIGISFGILPSIKAANLSPVDAIRHV